MSQDPGWARLAALAAAPAVCPVEQALREAAHAAGLRPGEKFPVRDGGRIFRRLADALGVPEGHLAERARGLGLWYTQAEFTAAWSRDRHARTERVSGALLRALEEME